VKREEYSVEHISYIVNGSGVPLLFVGKNIPPYVRFRVILVTVNQEMITILEAQRCNRPVSPEWKREEQARGRRVGEQQTEGSESFDFAEKRMVEVVGHYSLFFKTSP
jgi:hypothetical protein